MGCTEPDHDRTPEPEEHALAPSTRSWFRAKDGPKGPIPKELDHWNWGVFLWLTYMWSSLAIDYVLADRRASNLGLPVVLPSAFLIFLLSILLGMKGNRLAWRYGRYRDIEQIRATERMWTYVAIILISLRLFVVVLVVIQLIYRYSALGSV